MRLRRITRDARIRALGPSRPSTRLYLAYSCVAISDLDSATIKTWRSAGVVYLVGSYISIFPPTNLPAGRDITQALWQRILRKSDLAFLGNDLNEFPSKQLCIEDWRIAVGGDTIT